MLFTLTCSHPKTSTNWSSPLFFKNNADKIICLDEIQLTPSLFPLLRSKADRDRQNGKLILLGSASRDLIQQTSETLTGRIGLIHLTLFTINEILHEKDFNLHTFWLRGGFPDSYLAANNKNSNIWWDNFIKTIIERDIPQLGFQIPALQLRRFLMMCSQARAIA